MTTPSTAGKRDRHVLIQQLSTVTEPGFPVENWETLARVWASKDDMSQRERFVAQQNSAPADTKWSLPYSPVYDPELVDVAKGRRLVYRERVYDIVSALIIGRREGVEIVTLSGGLLT